MGVYLEDQINVVLGKSSSTGSSSSSSKTSSKETKQPVPVDAENCKDPLCEKNWTDPYVYHDPLDLESIVAKIYEPQNASNGNNDEQTVGTNQNEDHTKVDGIYTPIIKLNNFVIDSANIENMTLKYESFLPTLDVWIKDPKKMFSFKDVPGQNNVITLILLPPKDGAYKKIKLDFYIKSYVEFNDGYEILYNAEYKNFMLRQNQFLGLKHAGCNNPDCSTPENKEPNTWEYLHDIAIQCGLGFASTRGCKDIEDRTIRLLQNTSYHDFILENIIYGGLDENSFFDCWVDLYNYIVLVNVPNVLNDEVIDSDHLTIHTTKGTRNTSNDVPEQEFETVTRTLHNSNVTNGVDDLSIEKYQDLSKPGDLFGAGNLQTYTSFTMEGVTESSDNNISVEQTMAVENSADGLHTDEYEVATNDDVKMNFNNYDINVQESKRTLYFTKLRSRRLKVTLRRTNFGLQRGTLVNVIINEYDSIKKDIIIKSSTNISGDTSNKSKPDDLPGLEDVDVRKNIVENDSAGVVNPALSGLYYIDSMVFYYDYFNQEIKQELYLIKKGIITNLTNKHTAPRLDDVTSGMPKPSANDNLNNSSASNAKQLIGI